VYILSFRTSRSKYFRKGLNMAIGLGGTWDGKTMILNIPDNKLLGAYEMLLPLFEIVENWSSLKATYNGKEVEPYRFILVMHFIRQCAGMRKKDRLHCWLNVEEKGWGCKRISNIMYGLSGNGEYRMNEKYWYNFGKFDEKNEWIIDRERLFRRLSSFAEEKGLTLCPYFRTGEVKRAVERLPSSILADDISFRLFYEEDYYKGRKVRVPVNIRHISNTDPESRIIGEYNLDAIKPIDFDKLRKKRPEPVSDIFWKRFSRN
jgi:hypothetical protein